MLRIRSLAVAVLLLAVACKPQPNPAIDGLSTSSDTQRAPAMARPSADQAPRLVPKENKVSQDSTPGGATDGAHVVKVGLLLPLTGRNAELGRAMQDAATVSLFDKYARLPLSEQRVKVELLPKDTGDSPQMARAAAFSAVQDGADLVIGPIFSDATEAVSPILAEKKINVLSFSNNRSQARAGTYLLGFSPSEQTMRVVDFAINHDHKRIAVLVPHSPLGDEVLAAAQASAKHAGLSLAASAQYSPQGMGLDTALMKLLPNGRGDPGFDALLLADGGPTLETILRTLSARGITTGNMQFLGTGIWDDAQLLRRVNLDGAWFASSNPNLTAQFESRFNGQYHYTPPRIASLAYDAVALAVTLATSNRPYTQDNLSAPAGFVGPANGIFRLRPDSTAERGLAVIKVEGGSLKVISPAPTGFVAN